jgi:small multidrug resistance pump
MAWFYLSIAIVSEVIGTLALKSSDGFTHLPSSTLCIIAYSIAFYCLSLVVKDVSVGVAYAIWSGAGIVLITALSALLFKQIPDFAALVGMTLIIAGVIVINIFSKSVSH